MIFGIQIKHERKIIRLQVEKLSETKTRERYKIIVKNQNFVLENNLPLLRSKGLKYFPVKWVVVEGGYNHPYILEQISKAIEAKLGSNETQTL